MRKRPKQLHYTSKNAKWTPEEDAILMCLVQEYIDNNQIPNWQSIAAQIPGKTIQQCNDRWNKCLDPKLRKGNWTAEEDQIIMDSVNQYGPQKWTLIASHLPPGRTGKQCRERWGNVLDPNIDHSPWTQQDEDMLIELVQELGKKWVLIAKSFPGRTANQCNNQWNQIKRRKYLMRRSGNPTEIPFSNNPTETPPPSQRNDSFSDFSVEPTKSPACSDDPPERPTFSRVDDPFSDFSVESTFLRDDSSRRSIFFRWSDPNDFSVESTKSSAFSDDLLERPNFAQWGDQFKEFP
jgi:hypothetical protein